MASLASALNVYNTCLRILRVRGYELWIKEVGKDENNLAIIDYWARKGDQDFVAPNPIELLGLVTIYEFKNPLTAPDNYWWGVEGEDIWDELFEKEFKVVHSYKNEK